MLRAGQLRTEFGGALGGSDRDDRHVRNLPLAGALAERQTAASWVFTTRATGAGEYMYNRRDEGLNRKASADRRLDGRALGIGLLVGAALGAGAALLLAPSSGEDTRRQLRRGARKLYARSSEAVSDLREDTDRLARRLARRSLKRSRDLAREVRRNLDV
jgi:gas vesicle protein